MVVLTVGHVTAPGQLQHVEVLQLVHWAHVVAAQLEVVAAVVAAFVAEHCADTFIAANSESTVNSANTGTITFLMFFSPILCA
ncbi:MAG: hypothetical protein ABSE80_10370 [Halobacteriota archaeon]